MGDIDTDSIMVVMLMMVTAIVSALFGTGIGETAVRREAIRANVAEYAPDQDGAAVFKWKTINK